MKRTYVYPYFSTLGAFGFRSGGPGLGNLLFPYVRAVLLAERYGWTLINPSWGTFKIGTLLRRESDSRWYLNIFNAQGISGIKKTALLLTHPKFREADLGARANETSAITAGPRPGSIVLTSGMGNHYKDFMGQRDVVEEVLWKLVTPADRARIDAFGTVTIGVHIRLGDFKPREALPISWYVEMVQKVRAAAGKELPVTIASDGTEEELAEILRLPGVRRLSSSAVVDLFALSRSRILLASDSTFSAWAAFIGRVPVIWGKRGAHFEALFADGTPNELVPAGRPLPPSLVEYIHRI